MTGALTLPGGTAGAPSLSFTIGGADTGFYATGAGEFHAAVSGASKLWFTGGGVYATGTVLGVYQNSSYLAFGTSLDIKVHRDAAATLAQRNGTNAQTFKVYGTTDAGLTNYERLAISAQQGVGFTIGAETLGTGADNLDITIAPAGNGSLKLPGSTSIDASGYGILIGCRFSTSVGVNYYSTGVRMRSTAELAWTSGLVDVGVDLAFHRDSAGVAAIDNGTAGTYRDLRARNLITNPGKFAALVDAATAGKGARAFINDGAGAVFGVAAAGGGALNVPVYSDGTNWIVG
jgi:hypothetical protein